MRVMRIGAGCTLAACLCVWSGAANAADEPTVESYFDTGPVVEVEAEPSYPSDNGVVFVDDSQPVTTVIAEPACEDEYCDSEPCEEAGCQDTGDQYLGDQYFSEEYGADEEYAGEQQFEEYDDELNMQQDAAGAEWDDTNYDEAAYAEESQQFDDRGVEPVSGYCSDPNGGCYGSGDCYSSMGDCCESACTDCCQSACCCPPKPFYLMTFGEFLYLRPTGGDVTHAQQQDGIGGTGTVPFGRIASIRQDYEPGFRVGFAGYLGGGASVSSSYTFFESDAADYLTPPVIPGGGGAIRSLVHHPGSAITASTGPVTANQRIDFQMVDVLFNQTFYESPRTLLGYSLGAVYGNLDQQFNQQGVFAGGAGGTIDTDTAIDFSGGGLKAGANIERIILPGLLVYGKLKAAAMSGRASADYNLQNTSTRVTLGQARWEDNRVVSHVEYELGVTMRTSSDRLRLSAGYQFQHWGNVISTSDFIDAVQADNYTGLGDTLSFDGLVLRIEGRF
ncbi:MAG: Lpg1974 family pore-forming outer membrane protein [Planctomycetota bacterium]